MSMTKLDWLLLVLALLLLAGCATPYQQPGSVKPPQKEVELTDKEKEMIVRNHELTIVEQHFERCVTTLAILETMDGYSPMKEEVSMNCTKLVLKRFPQLEELPEAEVEYLRIRFMMILNSVRW